MHVLNVRRGSQPVQGAHEHEVRVQLLRLGEQDLLGEGLLDSGGKFQELAGVHVLADLRSVELGGCHPEGPRKDLKGGGTG